MYQIDNSSAAPALPASTAPGTTGFFTDGNPALGVAATILPAEFMNMLMLEVLNVLGVASVTPSKADFTQLATAITRIIQVGGSQFGLDAGAVNAYSVPFAPVITQFVDGLLLRFRAKTANAGASTFAPNMLLAKPVIGLAGKPLQGGEIAANGMCLVVWSSIADAWILLSCVGGSLQVANATQSLHAVNMGQLSNSYITYFMGQI